jgi:hypothetical protein
VSGPVNFAVTLTAAHPFAWNLLFAAIQVLIGVGLLVPRTARLALIASIAWALGVWYLGEGLSGLASGHASILTGAPGSALLYAVIAAAVLPRGRTDRVPARWLAWAWALLWVGAAVYQLLPARTPGVRSQERSRAARVAHHIGLPSSTRRSAGGRATTDRSLSTGWPCSRS